jgi:hypothetical protein
MGASWPNSGGKRRPLEEDLEVLPPIGSPGLDTCLSIGCTCLNNRYSNDA